jgi:hypothetical protein
MSPATESLVPTLAPATVIDRGGIAALSIGAMQQRVDMVLELMANVLEDGKDYGKIPGTDKPTLYKPGAEKLCMAFQLTSARPLVEDISSGDEIRYRVNVPIEARDGRELAVGVGEASTNEEKYRWRKPVCDEEFEETPEHLRREKWFKGKGGGNPYKSKQLRTSPADIANTVLKMAHKRAFIHATLLATAASSVFNQDLEDFTKELQESIVEGDTGTPKIEHRQPQRKSAASNGGGSSAMPAIPNDAQWVVGYVSKVFDDKKPAAILLKGNQTRYTTFNEAIAKEAKNFAGTDHSVRLAFTTTQKDGRTFHNAVGIVLVEEPAQPASPANQATQPAAQGQMDLDADDIFGGAGKRREPGQEG